MAFHFRDRPRLSERLRGKSGDEIFKEFHDQVEKEKELFFNRDKTRPSSARTSSMPRTSAFERAGLADEFPEWARTFPSRVPRSHPNWTDDLGDDPFAKYGFPFTSSPFRESMRTGQSEPSTSPQPPMNEQQQQPASPQEHGPVHAQMFEPPKKTFAQRNLSNELPRSATAPTPNNLTEIRNTRATSAPPDCPESNQSQPQPKRFISKIEINPVQPENTFNQAKPQQSNSNSPNNHSNKPPIPPTKPQQNGGGNVRNIPIFVEGRSSPVVNNDESQNRRPPSYHSPSPTPQYQSPSPTPQYQPTSPTPQYQPTSPTPQYQSPIPQSATPSDPSPKPSTTPEPPNQKSTPEPKLDTPPSSPKMQKPRDAMEQVMTVQQAVEEIFETITQFSGDRKSKDYIYLDEMLTRNLLTLDDVNVEGREDVRQARRAVIQVIQRCISLLEEKTAEKPEEPNTENAPLASEENMELEEASVVNLLDSLQSPPIHTSKEPIPLPYMHLNLKEPEKQQENTQNQQENTQTQEDSQTQEDLPDPEHQKQAQQDEPVPKSPKTGTKNKKKNKKK